MKPHQALCNTAESTKSVQTKRFVLAPLVIALVTLDKFVSCIGISVCCLSTHGPVLVNPVHTVF